MSERSDINENNLVVEPVVDVNCCICLDPLADRTTVKLRCSHIFHLDCIGSAFNEKNKMQCPTCRQIEKGEWKYAQKRDDPSSIDVDIDDLMPTLALGLTPEPSMGFHGPVWLDNVMSYAQRHLHPISASYSPYHTPNNGFMTFDGWGHVSPLVSMQQEHQFANRLAFANERRLQEMRYGVGSSSRGTSNGGGSISWGNNNGEVAALVNGGDTNRRSECYCGFCNR